ncbi:TIGR04222 domain-containing membrane protein [Lentzea sp. NPDC051838]|uniref:TIGR04222 domain-containing membrane protein n=1 Tax=Lentzea sp. NPDC051838 TaxID=3154849 RepID=UPI003417CF5C
MTTSAPEELGCLTGGPHRAAEVALARLLHSGLVRVSRTGLVTAVRVPGLGPATPLEAGILGGLGHGRSLGDVLRVAATSGEAAGLREHLAGRGLLRRRRSRRPRLHPWLLLLGFLLALPGFVVLLFPEILEFFAETKPWLAFVPRWAVFAAGILLIVWASVLNARDPGRLRTRAGYLVVKRTKASPRDPLGAVAVLGLRGKVGGVAVAGMFGLTPAMIPGRGRTSGGSCGSGSGCGGGGDGGGCGGCGGGGD